MQTTQRRTARRRRPKSRTERILIGPEFALLWLKQSVTALCDALFSTTLILWLATSPQASPLTLGLGLVSLGLPYALFGPFAEAATERWSRRRTMFVTDVVRGILTFFLCIMVLPVLTPKRALAVIYLLCFFIGLMSRFSLAAQRSAITAVVRPKEHARGISRIQGSVAIMGIAGPILAAMLFLVLGSNPLPGLVLAGFLLLLSAGGAQAMDHEFTAKVRAIQTRRKRRGDTQGDAGPDAAEEAAEVEEEPWHPSVLRSGMADSFKGIRLVLKQRPFGSIAITVALVAFVGGIFNVLEVFFVSAYLGYPAAFLGLLISANAAGVLLGSAWFRQLDAHLTPITTFTFAVLGMGLTTAGFVSTRSLDFAILWAAAMGVTNGMILFSAQTALVETGERSSIGRLFVGYETLTAWLGVIGIFIGSVAAMVLSIGIILGIDSGLLIVGAAGAWLVLSGRAAHFRYHKAAAQNTDEHERPFVPPDEAAESYEPEEGELPEEQLAEFDDADQAQEEEAPVYRRPSRQFSRPWAGPAGNRGASEYEAGYEEDAEPQYAEESEEQWEQAAPVDEPPEPRRSLRLRPQPWEQSGGPGRRR
jgi:MFS family permease